jgi:tRNA(Ile)-lysidine synthase
VSGRALHLGGGWSLRRDLDRLVLAVERDHPPDRPLLILDAGPGSGDARIAGERIADAWGEARRAPFDRAAIGCSETFDPDGLRFPLTVRAREPGDQIRLPGGSKKVKKLFLERRIPARLRARTPLLVDAQGNVIWIPEVARAEPRRGGDRGDGLRIRIG